MMWALVSRRLGGWGDTRTFDPEDRSHLGQSKLILSAAHVAALVGMAGVDDPQRVVSKQQSPENGTMGVDSDARASSQRSLRGICSFEKLNASTIHGLCWEFMHILTLSFQTGG